MSKSYNVIFYSKEHNLILAKEIKDLMARKGCGVINIDDISTIFIDKDLFIKYIILDFTSEKLSDSFMFLIEKMILEGLIDKVIVICNERLNLGENFFEVINDSNRIRNINKLFNLFLKEDNSNASIMMGSWRRIICEKLIEWGFSLKQNGTMLIMEGVIYYISRNSMIKNLNKEFYEFASKKYEMSKYSVELNMRKSITLASKGEMFPKNIPMTNKSFLTFSISYFYDILTTARVVV